MNPRQVFGARNPDALQSLTGYSDGWFGLAIASGYSYFGVNRDA